MGAYLDIEKAINKITTNKIPGSISLNELAALSGMSTGHFQKLFSKWAGISAKQFSQYIKSNQSKNIIVKGLSNADTSHKVGLSGTSRLHDLFVSVEAMTPDEYQHGGKNLTIYYSLFESKFGLCTVACTDRGIVNILFVKNQKEAAQDLRLQWPQAQLVVKSHKLHIPVKKYLTTLNHTSKIKLLLHGTNFQIKVWEALLTIPQSRITHYNQLAQKIGDKKLSRAVGNAVGKNPISYIIPCHRVLKSTGEIGGYHWGQLRKKAMLAYESMNNMESSQNSNLNKIQETASDRTKQSHKIKAVSGTRM